MPPRCPHGARPASSTITRSECLGIHCSAYDAERVILALFAKKPKKIKIIRVTNFAHYASSTAGHTPIVDSIKIESTGQCSAAGCCFGDTGNGTLSAGVGTPGSPPPSSPPRGTPAAWRHGAWIPGSGARPSLGARLGATLAGPRPELGRDRQRPQKRRGDAERLARYMMYLSVYPTRTGEKGTKTRRVSGPMARKK